MKKVNHFKRITPPSTTIWGTVIYTVLLSLMPLFGFSQSNCSTAVTQPINIQTDYQFQAQQTEYWLYFTADDSTVNVQLMKPNSSPWGNSLSLLFKNPHL